MTEMRHVTNLQTPYDALDTRLLANLGTENTDYVIGDPIPAKRPNANPLAVLQANGVVGLYVTYAAVMQMPVRGQTGWNIAPASWAKLPVLS
jgi:hypothetical protein